MTRIEERRTKIKSYIDRFDQSPLVFKVPYRKDTPIVPLGEGYSMTIMVQQVLEMSSIYASINSTTGILETSAGRFRSSFDIWRHIKSVIPDADIYSVMEAIYELRRKIAGHYCTTVHRAVFHKRGDYNNSIDEDTIHAKEYRITFSTWKCLHGGK